MPKLWSNGSTISMPPSWRPSGVSSAGWYSMLYSANGQAWKTGDPKPLHGPFRPYERWTFRVSEPAMTQRPYYGRAPTFNGNDPYTGNSGWLGPTLGFTPLWWARPHNEAWGKLVQHLRGEDTPQLLVLAGEARQGLTMVTTRLGWLRKAYTLLRKGRFAEFLRFIGKPPLPHHRKYLSKKEYYRSGRRVAAVARNSSALWLEYWFGWAPTVSDIYKTMRTLTAEHTIYTDPFPAWGSAWLPLSPASNYTAGLAWSNVVQQGRIRVRQGVLCTVDNPNLFLLNKLGLVDVAGAAWELLPFSFVVDWFFKLGNVIASFTDFVGLKIHESYTSVTVKFTSVHQTGGGGPGVITFPVRGVRMRRKVGVGTKGLTRPVVLHPVRLDSVYGPLNRARTASALLTQLFLADALSGRGRN